MQRRYPALFVAALLLLPGAGRADDPHGDLALSDSLRAALVGRLGENRLRVSGDRLHAATSIKFSPDGEQAVAFGPSGELLVFDPHSLAPLHTAWLPSGTDREFEFTADSRRLVEPHLMQLLEFRDSRPAYLPFPSNRSNRRATASRAGSFLVRITQADRIDESWLVRDRDEPYTSAQFEKPFDNVLCLAVSDNRGVVAAMGDDHTIRVWNRKSGKLLREWRSTELYAACLALAPDGASLAAVRGREVVMGNIDTGIHTTIHRFDDPVTTASLAYSPDGARLALGDNQGQVRLFDLADNSLCQRSLQQGSVATLLFSADGSSLCCGCRNGAVVVCAAPSLEATTTLDKSDGEIISLALSDDGRRLATGDARGTFAVWDLEKQHRTGRLPGRRGSVEAISFSLDHARLDVVIHTSDRLARYNTDCSPPQDWRQTAPSRGGFAQSPDGRYFASVTFDVIQLWDAKSGVRLQQLTGPYSDSIDLLFSPDSRRIAAAGLGLTIVQSLDGDPETKITVGGPPGQHGIGPGMAFSPDSRRIAIFHDSEIVFHDVETGETQHVLGLDQAEGSIRPEGMQFTPDGRLLIAPITRPERFAKRVEVGVWDTASGELLYTFGAATFTAPFAIALSPDGKRLLTGLGDGTILAWDFAELTRRQIGAADAPPLVLDEAWEALAASDPAAARRGIMALCAHPEDAARWIDEKLPKVERPRLTPQELIARLASDDPDVRRAASSGLRALGTSAREAMQSALQALPPPAVRSRLELLLAVAPSGARGDELRLLRAVEVLERIGGERAVAVLRRIAAAAPSAPAGGDAQSALQRLKQPE